MKIAIDARWIFREISGIGAYTQELLKHLALVDRKNAYVLFFDDEQVQRRTFKEANLGDAPNFSVFLLSHGPFSLRSQLLLPKLLRRTGIDVFHSPNYMIPLAAFPKDRHGSVCGVVTVHDVIPLILPDHAPRSKKTRLYPLYRRLMIEVGARAHAIITVSNASKQDVIRHLCIDTPSAYRVKTIYNGVSERFTCRLDNAATADGKAGKVTSSDMAGTNGRTILYVGRADPYKNLAGLIRAFAAVRKTCPFPVALKIVGSRDPRYPEAAQLAAELGVGEAVSWTGYVPGHGLPSVYRAADLLVHPSRYEGFGLQILEAMACGLPVVCSNAASLPEVAGDAAILVDPEDIFGLTESIEKVLTQPELAREMSRKGVKQAAGFRWSRTAEETLAAYEEVRRQRPS